MASTSPRSFLTASLKLSGCSGDAFYINENYGGSPVDSCENLRFFGGGVYDHTGDIFDITGGADTLFVNFDK